MWVQRQAQELAVLLGFLESTQQPPLLLPPRLGRPVQVLRPLPPLSPLPVAALWLPEVPANPST